MAATDHTDDTILDEELDENEFNLTNENDDNEDVLLAESEFDFIDKRTSPLESQSHPLPIQETKTNVRNEEQPLEAEEDVLDIGIADEDIETITFQEVNSAPKVTEDQVSTPSSENIATNRTQSNENDNKYDRSDVGGNSTSKADHYDMEESTSSPSAKASREPPSNDDNSVSDTGLSDHSAYNDNESDKQKSSIEAKAAEDDRNISLKQQRKILLKKPTCKTYDDLPDLSKVIEKVHPVTSARNRRKVEEISNSSDRSRARYKRRKEYEEDKRRIDYRRPYHSGNRYSDDDYDSDERRSPRRTRSPLYFERDENSNDYDRFELQGENKSCIPFENPYYTPDEYSDDPYVSHPPQQSILPSNNVMDGSVVTSVQITQQTYQIGGDFRLQNSERIVVSHPPHDLMPPRPFAPRPLMQQPTPSPMPPIPRHQMHGQFHHHPPSATIQQPSFSGPSNLHHPSLRMPPRSQNHFPLMPTRPGAGPPPRGIFPPPLRPQLGQLNGPHVTNVRQPHLSSGFPPAVGHRPPPPRPMVGPPPQIHQQPSPNMHRGPPPGLMGVPRPPPNHFVSPQPSPGANNFNRLPPAPPHIRPQRPLTNNYRTPFANTLPNFQPSNNTQYAQNTAGLAPPPSQNFRPNPPQIMGPRSSWTQGPPQPSSFGAVPTQYRHPQPIPQAVERSHNDGTFDNSQMTYVGVGNDNFDRYFDDRDQRQTRESEGRISFNSPEHLKRVNSSPIRNSPTKLSRFDYATSNSTDVNKDEDEEMRLYQEKVEQQKKTREQYVRQKEEERLKSQMQNFIQNNIKGILEKREQLMRKQAANEDRERYESSRIKTSSRSDHDDYRSGRREERSGYDDPHNSRRNERSDYETVKRTVYNRDAETSRRDLPPKKDTPVISTASSRSQFQYRVGNSSTERKPESVSSSKKLIARRSPSVERRSESVSSKKIVIRRSPSAERRPEPLSSKKVIVRKSTSMQEYNVVAQKKMEEVDSTKKELHKLMKVRYKDGSVAYKSIPVRNSSGNIVTTAVDAPESADRQTSDADAHLSGSLRKRAEQSDVNSRSRPPLRRAVVSSHMPTPNVTNEPTDEKTLIESIRKGIRQSSKSLAERFSNLKPSFVSDNVENELEYRELKKFRRVISDTK